MTLAVEQNSKIPHWPLIKYPQYFVIFGLSFGQGYLVLSVIQSHNPTMDKVLNTCVAYQLEE